MFRRSGVVPQLDGDEQRIFDAVVKPDRAPQRADGNVEAERERLREEIARAEEMLANERFVAERARRGGRRPSARSSSATAASSMRSAGVALRNDACAVRLAPPSLLPAPNGFRAAVDLVTLS